MLMKHCEITTEFVFTHKHRKMIVIFFFFLKKGLKVEPKCERHKHHRADFTGVPGSLQWQVTLDNNIKVNECVCVQPVCLTAELYVHSLNWDEAFGAAWANIESAQGNKRPASLCANICFCNTANTLCVNRASATLSVQIVQVYNNTSHRFGMFTHNKAADGLTNI